MTYILSIDTTHTHSSMAIAKDKNILIEYNFISTNNLSFTIIPTINSILNEIKLNLENIDIYGIANGPGLFTGIRVGLATLKGLIFDNKKPVVPVPTFKALAYKFVTSHSSIITLIDAKRDELYIAGFTIVSGEVIENLKPQLIKKNELALKIKKKEKLCFTGSGAEIHHEFLKENFPGSEIIIKAPFLAREICHLAYREFLKKDFFTDLQKLLPFYIRKPDAEQKRESG